MLLVPLLIQNLGNVRTVILSYCVDRDRDRDRDRDGVIMLPFSGFLNKILFTYEGSVFNEKVH